MYRDVSIVINLKDNKEIKHIMEPHHFNKPDFFVPIGMRCNMNTCIENAKPANYII